MYEMKKNKLSRKKRDNGIKSMKQQQQKNNTIGKIAPIGLPMKGCQKTSIA